MAFIYAPSFATSSLSRSRPSRDARLCPLNQSFTTSTIYFQNARRLERPMSLTPVSSAAAPSVGAAVGTSSAESTDQAVAEAVKAASSTLPASPIAAIVLSTVDRPAADVQAALRAQLPGVAVHGATSCGATLTNDGPVPGAISVLLLYGPPGSVSVSSRSEGDVGQATIDAAREAISKLSSGVASQFLVFATPGTEESVLSSLSSEFPNTPVFGGSAADNTVEGLWQIFSYDGEDNKKPISEGVSILALGPEIQFGAALVPPYTATERSALVTDADGRVLKTLDNRPAAEVLKEWVGDGRLDAGGSVIVECATFPLGVEKSPGKYVGIHAAEITPEGYVGLFAEVHKGEKLTVMKPMGDAKDSVGAARNGLEAAYAQAMQNGRMDNPKAGLLIYCGGLSIAVGDRLGESLEVMKGKAGVLGMTAFGEQGSFDNFNVHSNLAVGVALFQ